MTQMTKEKPSLVEMVIGSPGEWHDNQLATYLERQRSSLKIKWVTWVRQAILLVLLLSDWFFLFPILM